MLFALDSTREGTAAAKIPKVIFTPLNFSKFNVCFFALTQPAQRIVVVKMGNCFLIGLMWLLTRQNLYFKQMQNIIASFCKRCSFFNRVAKGGEYHARHRYQSLHPE